MLLKLRNLLMWCTCDKIKSLKRMIPEKCRQPHVIHIRQLIEVFTKNSFFIESKPFAAKNPTLRC